MARLTGKVAIVTGAAGGIGSAIAARFSREGAAVVCVDRDAAGLDGAVRAARAAGGRALGVAADVALESTAQECVARALGDFGRLDILVSNAVHDLPLAPVTDISLEDWRGSMAVNLDSAFLFAKHAIPAMVRIGGGRIILVASELARVAKPGRTWYSAAKGALVSLARALAVDHAHQGIRVNSLSPGPVETGRYLRKFATPAEAHAASGTLFARAARPDEIADGAVFLASDESAFMTGADLLIDGGRTAV